MDIQSQIHLSNPRRFVPSVIKFSAITIPTQNTLLLNGDCIELMRDIPAGSVDLILCDQPYGTTRNKWDAVIPQEKMWGQYRRIIKPNGAIILFASGRFTASVIMAAGDMYKYSLVWQKTNPTGFLNSRRQPLRSHEDIVVCYKKQPVYNPQKTTGHKRKTSTAEHKRNLPSAPHYSSYGKTTYDSTERFPTSVLTFSSDKQKLALHPCQKPVALLEWLIKSYTNEGAVVLDNCMGSGSTGVACVGTNRKFIGMEISKEYFDIAKNRIEQLLSEKEREAAS